MKIKYLAFFLLIAFSCSLYNCKNKENKDEETAENTDSVKYPDYNAYQPNEKGTEDSTVTISQDSVNKEPVMVENNDGSLKKTDLNNANVEGNFYIIVGSFKNQANALKQSNHFKAMSYNTEVLPQVGEYFRVSVGTYTDKPQAVVELNKLRKKHNDATFWILLR